MKYLKNIISASSLIMILGMVFLPTSSVKAVGLPAFGGLVNFSIPCTCSGTLWVWHTPLFLSSSPVPLTGPLVYSPFSTIPYPMYFFGVPGHYDLGSYIPGVQACWMFAVVACLPLPSIGLMVQVGTN